MKEKERFAFENEMESLPTLETGYAVLTLEEAMQTFENESQLFKLQLKSKDSECLSHESEFNA